MHCLKRLLVLLAAIFISVSVLPAVVMGAAQTVDTDRLERLFLELVSGQTPWPVSDLGVVNFSANPTELVLPGGSLEFSLLNYPQNGYLGKKKFEVAALVNGKEEARVILIGQVKLFGDVVVTTRRLGRHKVVEESDLRVVRRDISQMAEDFLQSPKDAEGLRVKRSLRAGAPIFAGLLENEPLVKRGDRVTIEAKSGAVSVTVPGEVRSTGALGDSVRVKNLMSRREIYAEVIDGHTVRVVF